MDNSSAQVVAQEAGLDSLDKIAGIILKKLQNLKICVIEGEMGAGKTTLIKALCSRLGVDDTVSSPTFSLVNEYYSEAGPVYHFDFYRIKSLEEALNAGVEEYLYSGNYCFIEWPGIILDILPEEYLKIDITFGENNDRLYKLISYGSH